MVVELRFFHTIISPTSAPQIRRYQQEPVNGRLLHGALQFILAVTDPTGSVYGHSRRIVESVNYKQRNTR